MTISIAFHPQGDDGWLYIPRNNGGRGIISLEDFVEMEKERLKKFVESSNERLLNGMKREGNLGGREMKK